MANPPLKGLRVVELARILAGPWAGQCLADLGAEVIKIEHPQGDDTRHWGPPFVTAPDGQRNAAYFYSCNRGKQSIALALDRREDNQIARDLIASADIVIENFKHGGLKKYDLDYASVKPSNPGLIYCSITGFGQTGPYADRAGYDLLIQSMSGIMDLTGEADGPPQKAGVAFADIFTALYAVMAIQTALIQRAENGAGAYLDLSLLDCQVGVLANQALNYFVSGVAPRRRGNAHPNIVPYQVFAVADGYVIIGVGNHRHFTRLCAELDRDDLAADPRFADNASRVKHRDILVAELVASLALHRRDVLLEALYRQGVPAGPINQLDEAFADPQIIHRAMKHTPHAAGLPDVPGLRLPIMMDGQTFSSERPAPLLDGDRAAILANLDKAKALKSRAATKTDPIVVDEEM